jgi:hypothetical protein
MKCWGWERFFYELLFGGSVLLATALGCALILWLAGLMGCGDGGLGDECLTRRDAAEPRLERAIDRYAAAANASLIVLEGSGTWACDGGPDVTLTLDFDLVLWDGVRRKTGTLTVWGDLEVFEVEDAEGSTPD